MSELNFCYDMLVGNLNRMNVTDDLNELFKCYIEAKYELDSLFYGNYSRLKKVRMNLRGDKNV